MPGRAIVMSLVVAASFVMLALPYDAAADCRERTSLSPPSDGESVDAIGRAQVQSNDSGERQTFTVEVDVDVPEGTPLFVFANGDRLPSGVDPVCSIGPVLVTDADGATVLTGSF